jgi:hypothetical protein
MDIVVFNGAESPVLDINRYYAAPIVDAAPEAVAAVRRDVLARTVAFVQDARNGVAGAHVIDGFTNKLWGATALPSAPGAYAFSRHLSVKRMSPTDAVGTRWLGPSGRTAAFAPVGSVLFPELSLTALVPERFLSDLRPGTRGDGGASVALTAFTLDPERSAAGAALAPDEARRALTRSVLRALAAYVGKGVESVTFYEANARTDLAVAGAPMGGETLLALQRFLREFDGPALEESDRRSVKLLRVGDCSGARQFEGDGSAAHPPLLDRDVVAFFPFQKARGSFVIPVYVMTRDVTSPYAERPFSLAIEGVHGVSATVSALDPITGQETPVEVERRSSAGLQVTMALTDAPRLLRIDER